MSAVRIKRVAMGQHQWVPGMETTLTARFHPFATHTLLMKQIAEDIVQSDVEAMVNLPVVRLLVEILLPVMGLHILRHALHQVDWQEFRPVMVKTARTMLAVILPAPPVKPCINAAVHPV